MSHTAASVLLIIMQVHDRWWRSVEHLPPKQRGAFRPATFARQVLKSWYCKMKARGLFDEALARAPIEVRRHWRPRVDRLRTPADRVLAVQWQFGEWQREDPSTRRAWSRAYLDARDPALVRSLERRGEAIDTFVASLGGEIAASWRPTKMMKRRAEPVRRSVESCVRDLRRLYRAWYRGGPHGRGKRIRRWSAKQHRWVTHQCRFGQSYLRYSREYACCYWMIRHRSLRKCLRLAGPEIARAWYHKKQGKRVLPMMPRIQKRPAPLAIVRGLARRSPSLATPATPKLVTERPLLGPRRPVPPRGQARDDDEVFVGGADPATLSLLELSRLVGSS